MGFDPLIGRLFLGNDASKNIRAANKKGGKALFFSHTIFQGFKELGCFIPPSQPTTEEYHCPSPRGGNNSRFILQSFVSQSLDYSANPTESKYSERRRG